MINAKTWDSYKETLEVLLRVIKPKKVAEYGPGASTRTMARFPSVEKIYTVEHAKRWYNQFAVSCPSNVVLIYRPNFNDYAHSIPLGKYDLAFIDGRRRVECMRYIEPMAKVVLLHDAGREKYQEGINLFKYQYVTDGGATMVLTNDKQCSRTLQSHFPERAHCG